MTAREVQNNRLRGIRQTIPSGYVLGRTLSGDGPPHLIDMQTLAQQVAAQRQSAPINTTYTLAGLSDVTISAPSVNQVLTWNGTKWVNAAGGGGGAASVATLTDVTLTAIANNQFLQYNSGSLKWVNVTLGLSGLSDVDTTGIASGKLLEYNGTKWVPWTLVYTLAGASDVQLTAIADTQILQWNSGSSKFVNINYKLSTLSDVNAASPSNLDLLSWDTASSRWINRPSSAVGVSLAGLSDVTLTSVANYDGLRYNGSIWVNVPTYRWSWPASAWSTSQATAAACKGNAFMLAHPIVVDRISAAVNGTSGHVYGAFIGVVTGSGNAFTIASTLVTATPITSAITGWQTIEFTIAATQLNAGQTYCICIVDKSSSTTTTVLPLAIAGTTAGYADLPVDPGAFQKNWNVSGTCFQIVTYATLSDAPSALAVTSAGGGTCGVGLRWYYP